MKTQVQIKTLQIEGRDVSATGEQTILQVALENGIQIPRLCYVEGLSQFGACRLCLVEIKGSNKLQPACVTKVEEGMEVTVHSERLADYRKLILELLFSERNHICSVCVVNGHCELQSLAMQVGYRPHLHAVPAPEGRGGCLASALHARSQPLHPVRALRAGLRRDRRSAYLGRDGPRHGRAHHRRHERAVGQFGELHQLRQVRARVSDRRVV